MSMQNYSKLLLKEEKKKEKYYIYNVYSQFGVGGFREVENCINLESSWCLCRVTVKEEKKKEKKNTLFLMYTLNLV